MHLCRFTGTHRCAVVNTGKACLLTQSSVNAHNVQDLMPETMAGLLPACANLVHSRDAF